MSDFNIEPGTGKKKEDFVGIRCTSLGTELIFPIGFRYEKVSEGLTEEERKKVWKQQAEDGLLLLRSITRTQSKARAGIACKGFDDRQELPIQSYIFLITDYITHRLFTEKEQIYDTSHTGRISWQRTIRQIRPQLQGDEAYYLQFIVRKNAARETELITLLHEALVYRSAEYIGCLFGFSMAPPRLKENTIKDERDYFVTLLKKRLATAFNDRHKNLFRHMLAVLQDTADRRYLKDYEWGTKSFQVVWESIINTIFGTESKDSYNPGASWKLWDKAQKAYRSQSANVLRPDTIMLTGGKVYILDAKYYGRDNYPMADSIEKQITYGEYAEQNADKLKIHKDSIFNAFILPNEVDINSRYYPFEYFGCAESEWKSGNKPYDKIIGVFADTKALLTAADRGDKNREYRELLADLIESEHSRI